MCACDWLYLYIYIYIHTHKYIIFVLHDIHVCVYIQYINIICQLSQPTLQNTHEICHCLRPRRDPGNCGGTWNFRKFDHGKFDEHSETQTASGNLEMLIIWVHMSISVMEGLGCTQLLARDPASWEIVAGFSSRTSAPRVAAISVILDH